MTYVYWLHLKTHNDITTEGYIGVTNDHNRRIDDHLYMLETNSHENIHLTNAYKKYGKMEMTILLEGPEDYCYEMEHKLRPQRAIGWNIAEGGANPPKVWGNQWNKGRKLSEERVQQIRDTTHFKVYNGSEEQKKMLSVHHRKIRLGKKWINNGVINKQHDPSQDLPEGFQYGRMIGWNPIENIKKMKKCRDQ